MKPDTQLLVFATMALDIGEVTEDNVEEWYWRAQFLDALSNEDTYAVLTREFVRRHIGLWVNVRTEKRASFIARHVKRHKENVLWHVNSKVDRELREAKEKVEA